MPMRWGLAVSKTAGFVLIGLYLWIRLMDVSVVCAQRLGGLFIGVPKIAKPLVLARLSAAVNKSQGVLLFLTPP